MKKIPVWVNGMKIYGYLDLFLHLDVDPRNASARAAIREIVERGTGRYNGNHITTVDPHRNRTRKEYAPRVVGTPLIRHPITRNLGVIR